MSCDNGYIVSIQETTVLRPGVGMYPAYSVSDVRVEQGVMKAHIGGGFPESDSTVSVKSMSADLEGGQVVTHQGVGAFRLIDVEPAGFSLASGTGGTAIFCSEPEAGFEVNSSLRP